MRASVDSDIVQSVLPDASNSDPSPYVCISFEASSRSTSPPLFASRQQRNVLASRSMLVTLGSLEYTCASRSVSATVTCVTLYLTKTRRACNKEVCVSQKELSHDKTKLSFYLLTWSMRFLTVEGVRPRLVCDDRCSVSRNFRYSFMNAASCGCSAGGHGAFTLTSAFTFAFLA